MTFRERLLDLADQFQAAKDRHVSDAAYHRQRFAKSNSPVDQRDADLADQRAAHYGRQLAAISRGKLLYEDATILLQGSVSALHPGHQSLMAEAIRTSRYELPDAPQA